MSPVPVIVVTGFLGSGKTTLLNHLLRDPDMADTAVIINEYGDVAIDHLLVESAIENAVVLQSGCICCTVRGDLVDTLVDLEAKAERGEIPRFTRVVVETTGLADPTPIVRLLATDPLISPRFTLRAVVTTVDAVNAPGQLDRFREAVRQAALADMLILTKTDLAEEAGISALEERLRRLNPGVEILRVVQGRVSARDLFERAPESPTSGRADIEAWLNAQAYDRHHDHDHHHDEHGHEHAHEHAHDHHHHDHDGHRHDHVHDDGIEAFAVTLEAPITREALGDWLGAITSLRGADLLRMKGIVNVSGETGPVVVHAVQHVMHPPVRLAAWPGPDHTTRIVFITENIPRAALQNSLMALTGA